MTATTTIPTTKELESRSVVCDADAVETAVVCVMKPRRGAVVPYALAFCGHHADAFALMLDLAGWKLTYDVRKA
jgi:hypothetical protein